MTGFESKREAAAGKLQEPVDIASIIACREMLDAQPVPAQEPVGWMCSAFDGEPCEQTNHDECGNPIPLYTTPPQRPWVGLTAEDFSAIKFPTEMRFPAEFRAGARWAETKLKERNHGT